MAYLFIQKNRKGGRILFSDLLPKCLQLIRLGQAEVRTWELYLCLRMGNRDPSTSAFGFCLPGCALAEC